MNVEVKARKKFSTSARIEENKVIKSMYKGCIVYIPFLLRLVRKSTSDFYCKKQLELLWQILQAYSYAPVIYFEM